MKWFTGDEHYFHHNIIEYCNRPYPNEPAMRKDLILRHNSRVALKDEVYHIGDFSMLGPSQWEKIGGVVRQLNGRHHLILGNHDECKPFTYINAGFTSVHTAFWFDRFVLAHDPSVYCMLPEESILLCSHIHTLFDIIKDKKVVNVGVDARDFYPVNIEQILLLL
jgi:calcineurin-like phosphoesterase family protein